MSQRSIPTQQDGARDVQSNHAGLSAPIWVGKGFFPDRGSLSLSGSRLQLDLDGRVEFNVDVSELNPLIWHWYSFSSAFETTVGGKRYFVSFLGPGNTLGSWWYGIQRGRLWRSELERRRESTSSPIAARSARRS